MRLDLIQRTSQEVDGYATSHQELHGLTQFSSWPSLDSSSPYHLSQNSGKSSRGNCFLPQCFLLSLKLSSLQDQQQRYLSRNSCIKSLNTFCIFHLGLRRLVWRYLQYSCRDMLLWTLWLCFPVLGDRGHRRDRGSFDNKHLWAYEWSNEDRLDSRICTYIGVLVLLASIHRTLCLLSYTLLSF